MILSYTEWDVCVIWIHLHPNLWASGTNRDVMAEQCQIPTHITNICIWQNMSEGSAKWFSVYIQEDFWQASPPADIQYLLSYLNIRNAKLNKREQSPYSCHQSNMTAIFEDVITSKPSLYAFSNLQSDPLGKTVDPYYGRRGKRSWDAPCLWPTDNPCFIQLRLICISPYLLPWVPVIDVISQAFHVCPNWLTWSRVVSHSFSSLLLLLALVRYNFLSLSLGIWRFTLATSSNMCSDWDIGVHTVNGIDSNYSHSFLFRNCGAIEE